MIDGVELQRMGDIGVERAFSLLDEVVCADRSYALAREAADSYYWDYFMKMDEIVRNFGTFDASRRVRATQKLTIATYNTRGFVWTEGIPAAEDSIEHNGLACMVTGGPGERSSAILKLNMGQVNGLALRYPALLKQVDSLLLLMNDTYSRHKTCFTADDIATRY